MLEHIAGGTNIKYVTHMLLRLAHELRLPGIGPSRMLFAIFLWKN